MLFKYKLTCFWLELKLTPCQMGPTATVIKMNVILRFNQCLMLNVCSVRFYLMNLDVIFQYPVAMFG